MMNQLTEHIINPEKLLYRYDLKQPPKDWSTDFKNPEYVYPDRGEKNQVGAFFFFDSFQCAKNTALYAFRKYNDKRYDGIWITKCTIKEPIKLLDLRDSIVCLELLAAFDKAEYNILCDELKTWNGIPFSKLISVIQPIEDIVLLNSNWDNNQESEQLVQKAIMEMQKILNIENCHIGLLLQLLTDFSNGFFFRSLLQEKGFEGYIFNETNQLFYQNGTDTICIFESKKLLPPCIVLQESS
jgi:hypothetical protein